MVKSGLSSVLDHVSAGEHVLICRRSRPLAALIPVADLDRFRELLRRDEELAAVLRGRGHHIDPWSTSNILEFIVGHLDPEPTESAAVTSRRPQPEREHR